MAFGLLERPVERLSLFASLRLAVEVTLLCLGLSILPCYLACRQRLVPWLPEALLTVAIVSLLVPTLARSLAMSALLSYYGPVATLLRESGLWPESQPLDSSHVAVVVALVTLYLPITLLLLIGGVRSLGGLPDTASQLGASPAQTFGRIVLPLLARPSAAAGLIVFSQTLGVIVTPTILGSNDVTLPMLIDDLLKKQLDSAGAVRVACAELALAVPIAVLAGLALGRTLRAPRRGLRPRSRNWVAPVPAMLLIGFLATVPVSLLILSVADVPVLTLNHPLQNGITLRWFSELASDEGWRSVLPTSFLVWITASSIALIGGSLLALFAAGKPRTRAVAEATALVTLFLPHNALGVLLAAGLREMGGLASALPSWFLGGLGQAVPASAVAVVLCSRGLQRIERPLQMSATLGAGPAQRMVFVALPALLPTALATLVLTTLVSLDDVVFVRYLPDRAAETVATELFARARFTSSPELAAVCVTIAALLLSLAVAGFAIAHRRRWTTTQGN